MSKATARRLPASALALAGACAVGYGLAVPGPALWSECGTGLLAFALVLTAHHQSRRLAALRARAAERAQARAQHGSRGRTAGSGRSLRRFPVVHRTRNR